MPMHGEYRMLKRHTELGVMCGINPNNTLICSNGDVIELYNGYLFMLSIGNSR